MKYIAVTAIALTALFLAGQASTGDEFKNPRSYGEELGESPAASISDVVGRPEDYNKETVILTGTVDQVCQNKGC